MSENKIYEITELMKDPDNLKNDINDAMGIVAEFFRKKYILPVEREVRVCSEECRKKPAKEAILLGACKPFVNNPKLIDDILEAMNSINVIRKLFPTETRIVSTSDIKDKSIHNDGIYDIDEQCKSNRLNTESISSFNPIILILIVLLLN